MGNVKSLLKLIPQIELIVFEDESDYINGSKTPCKIEMLEKSLHKLDEGSKQFYKLFKSFYKNRKLKTFPLKE